MKIQFRGQLTEADAIQMWRLKIRSSIMIWIIAAIFLLVAMSRFTSIVVPQPDLLGSELVRFAVFGAVFVALLWYTRYQDIRNMKRELWFENPVSGKITSGGVEIKGIREEGTYAWEFFSKEVRAADIVILFKPFNTGILPFPRAFFKNDADWQAFNDLVADKLSRRRSRTSTSTQTDT